MSLILYIINQVSGSFNGIRILIDRLDSLKSRALGGAKAGLQVLFSKGKTLIPTSPLVWTIFFLGYQGGHVDLSENKMDSCEGCPVSMRGKRQDGLGLNSYFFIRSYEQVVNILLVNNQHLKA